MWSKITNILGSIRFWIITFAWLAAYLGIVEQDGFTWLRLFDQIAKWLGTVAGLGSLDSIASRIGDNK